MPCETWDGTVSEQGLLCGSPILSTAVSRAWVALKWVILDYQDAARDLLGRRAYLHPFPKETGANGNGAPWLSTCVWMSTELRRLGFGPLVVGGVSGFSGRGCHHLLPTPRPDPSPCSVLPPALNLLTPGCCNAGWPPMWHGGQALTSTDPVPAHLPHMVSRTCFIAHSQHF